MTESLKKTRSFEELFVWQKAHQFVLEIYKLSNNFPQTELFNLTSQFRRAAVSIPANIAEGYKKKGQLDKLRFFNIAQGSLEECRYYIILSKDLNYINEDEVQEITKKVVEVSVLLNNYCNAMARNS